MSHQDWTNVTLRNPAKQKIEKTILEKRGNTSIIDEQRKIENDNENFSLLKIPSLLSKEIVNTRIAKKLTQKEAATKINVQLNVYTELENGKAIYSNATKQLINKLEKAFGTQFQNKKINTAVKN